MKKTILTIGMMLTIALTSVFANDNETVTKDTKAAFNNSFANATGVVWEKRAAFVKATFTLNSQVMVAFYHNDGELLAVTRNILSDQLPLNLMTDVKKNYSDHWVSELFEVASENQTSYYITLENADETLILKSSEFDGWSVYKRTKRA
jgi:hypothetical protein